MDPKFIIYFSLSLDLLNLQEILVVVVGMPDADRFELLEKDSILCRVRESIIDYLEKRHPFLTKPNNLHLRV
jgi:hypothetical protein